MSAAREAVSTRCDPVVWNEGRAAAQGMLAHDPRYSMAQLVEDAIRREVSRLAEEFNDGRPWEPTGALRRGRRIERLDRNAAG
ncbi:MAG: hypothetical protein L0H26_04745 [Microlunatus sp.]|nr:hypothetical protein [Microlunatus sp.]